MPRTTDSAEMYAGVTLSCHGSLTLRGGLTPFTPPPVVSLELHLLGHLPPSPGHLAPSPG